MKIATIHVDPTSGLTGLSPVRKILILIWLLALKDRATQVRHLYEPECSVLSYQVNGQWHELPGIPGHLASYVGEETRNWINPSGLRRRLADGLRRLANRFDPRERIPVQYLFMLILDPIWSIWRVTIWEENGKGEVSFELIECTEWSYEQAKQIQIDLWTPNRLTGIDLGTGMDGF